MDLTINFLDAIGNLSATGSSRRDSCLPACFQDGRLSEQLIGEWHEARGNGDQLVITTKVRSPEFSRRTVEGIALTGFRVLGGSRIRSSTEEERRRVTGEKGRMMPSKSWEGSEDDKNMCAALEAVAAQVGAKKITAVAIAYTMRKAPFLAYIDGILPFEKGYPNSFIGEYGGYPAVLAHYSIPPLMTSPRSQVHNCEDLKLVTWIVFNLDLGTPASQPPRIPTRLY
ncbi:hypothetical protein C8R47DRAFT_1074751 [Mycena vitilis]|nr:hypothetical protein C8R47DRAFT_1074751 [Mycena vitilis]